MSSSTNEKLPDSINTSNRNSNGRPTLSLGNQDPILEPNMQQSESVVQSKKSVNSLPTFILWSIFNLLFIPFGILCCYFSRKVGQFKIQNRYELAKKWSKRTFVLNAITTLLMFGVIITVVMLHYDFEQRNSDPNANQTLTTAVYIPWQPGR